MRLRIRLVRLTCAVLATVGVVASAPADSAPRGADSPWQVHALAPVEVLAAGFEEMSAVAVDGSGAILVTDRAAGTVTRIDPSGVRQTLLYNLQAPSGIAIRPQGDMYIVEAAARRVLKVDINGITSVAAGDLRQPRAIAAGPDGRVWIAMRERGGREADDGNDDRGPASEYSIARLGDSGTLTTIASGFMGVQGIAADGSALYVAMARLSSERGRVRTTVVRIPLRADGTAGPTEPLLSRLLARTLGIAVDASGDLFASGTKGDDDGEPAGAILKRRRTGEVTAFATGLNSPVALAFAPSRDLVAIEADEGGRVLRFRAPSTPMPMVPEFTNQNPLPISGRAGPGDRVEASWSAAGSDLESAVLADASSGQFSLQAQLSPNDTTELSFTATAAGGAGLVSPPVTVQVLHDDVLPRVTIAAPAAGAFVRDVVSVRARGEDEGSGVASMAFMLDDEVFSTAANDDPSAPFTAAAVLDTTSAAEGSHALTVAAADRAGNTGTAAQLLVVDRTPPETEILSGPGPETTERTVTFTVGGTDLLSPVLEFSWRLDEGVWSPFGLAASVVLSDLASGEHRFEVRARDLAGNEDPTPAVQLFSVTALRIRITEPPDGAILTGPSVWVRGTVDGSRDATVSVPLPPGMGLPALPASVAAGTFAVEVPIDPATTSLTAIATEPATASTAAHTINVVVQPGAPASTGRLIALPAAGLAPHVLNFSVNLPQGTHVELDLESDGAVDFDGGGLDGLSFVYQEPGIYVPTLRATTSDGQVSVYRTVVEVYDPAALDARLQAVWNGFRQALQEGDLARAVDFVHGSRRAAWQEYFSQLLPDEVTAEANAFTAIELVQVGRGGAEYEMLREENDEVFSYPIVFVADIDGRWRLWQF